LHPDSHTTRSNRAAAALRRWSALAVLLLAGCQNSNSQRDLVARELRMQEDQIYAMEDYINEYQQLLCKYRSENAALKRQMVDSCTIVETPQSTTAPRSKSSGGERSRVVPPATPGGNELPPNLEAPDIPPLQQTKPDGANLEFRPGKPGADLEDSEQASDVVAASYSTSDAASGTAAATGFVPHETAQPEIMLRGEVVANDQGGGPRLAIQVLTQDASGASPVLVGSVSLMLLAVDEQGAKQNLGRWDFGPEESQAAVDPTSGALLFHLELPAEMPITAFNELWVRLLPSDGGKLLAKAAVDLTRPGTFGSEVTLPVQPPKIASQIADAAGVDTVLPASYTMSSAGEDGWQLARPGEPANLPSEADILSGGWRAATQPVPEVVAQSVPADTSPKQPMRTPNSTSEAATTATDAPAWSPDRTDRPADDLPRTGAAFPRVRPRWSATR
jgi:hypothetical protein